MTNSAPTDVSTPTRFGKTFLALFVLGLPGILSLVPTVIGQLDALPPEMVALPRPLVAALSLLNPLILLALGVALGVLLAHRVGLRSLIAERVRQGTAIGPQLRPHLLMAFSVGLIFAVVVLGLDALIDPFAGTELVDGPAAGETATLGSCSPSWCWACSTEVSWKSCCCAGA